jgi:NAD(P)-dependent dehydrogenase (short-subunit alcohol dehydrogenase family)
MSFSIGRPDFGQGCAVIFGGSGGLGRNIAGLLAERGANVVITYNERRREAELLAAELGGATRAIAVQCDVTDFQSVTLAISTGSAAFGRVHTAVSAQGRKFERGPLAEASQDGLRAKLEMDVFGFLNIAQASTPSLRQGGGSLTAIVSPVLLRTLSGYGLGAAPKAAVASMVKYLAVDEGPHGVRVNAVAPGVINAGMAIAERPARAMLESAVQATPLRRMGDAAEIAELVAFLASAKAGYVTGQIIMADGGFAL